MIRRFDASLGLRLACAALVSVLLSFVYGMNPWAIGAVEPWVTDLGRVECGVDNTWQYLTRGVCPSIGYPEGSTTANGLIIPQFAVILATVMPAQIALAATYLLLIFLAICGAYAFFRWLGISSGIVLGATLAWMVNPSVYGMRNFGSTFWGMLLLPAYLWVFSRCVARLAAAFGRGEGSGKKAGASAVGWAGGAHGEGAVVADRASVARGDSTGRTEGRLADDGSGGEHREGEKAPAEASASGRGRQSNTGGGPAGKHAMLASEVTGTEGAHSEPASKGHAPADGAGLASTFDEPTDSAEPADRAEPTDSPRPTTDHARPTSRLGASLLAALATSLAATVAVKIDGYSYVMLMAAAGLLLVVGPLLHRGTAGRWARSGIGLAIVAQAAVVSYAVHLATADSNDWATAETDFFRSMGIDLSSLVWPSEHLFWGWLTGLGMDTGQLWGDGTNNHWNYLGLATIVLLALALLWARRGAGSARVWVVIGLVALVLAMGPSLKIYDVQGAASGPISVESYFMPAKDATFTWPWQGVFTALPGLSTMRAIYRWMAVLRLAVIVVGALAITRLRQAERQQATPAARRKLLAGATVAVLAIAGTLPAVPRDLARSMRAADSIASIRSDFSAAINRALPDGAIVVISSPVSEGNDFLAPLVSADSDITLYNTAGDKDLHEARQAWSPEIITVVTGQGDWAGSVHTVLATGQAHAVVVPNYDMRWDIDSWPDESYAHISRQRIKSLRQWQDLEIKRYNGFTIVTYRGA